MKGKKGFQSKENNPSWKGKNVGYNALHQWVGNPLYMPTECTCCGNVSRIDLANISGKYLRDLSDWEWLCRRSRMNKDCRINFRDSNGRFI